ncbi:cytochrome P450 6k1-like [Diachasma alloeum]|uniref:cytochrome P450 6k1-like n=1 Tax=Diachasma alloeum TaxID=454923 RepID=UPI000738363A|nr:cytochrome P450 6k1-like [Diachasma alloeum]
MSLLWNNWLLEAATLVLLIIYLIYRYMIRNFDYWKNRGVVFVPPSPIFGGLAKFMVGRTSVGRFSKEIYDYAPDEPYVGFFGFDKPMLMIRDPELIKRIFIKDFDYFKDRYASASVHDILGTANLFLLKHPGWKLLRTKISPIYTSKRLKDMVKLLAEVGQGLATHMELLDLKEPGRIVEIKEICSRYATDMIATTAFGLQANSLNNPTAEFWEKGNEMFRDTFYRSIELSSMFFAPFLSTPMRFRLFPQRFGQFMRTVIWDTINEREKIGFKRPDLIDLLVELKNQEADEADKKIFEFAGDNIVAQAAIFFVGGFETSSTAISFSLYELALQPEMQNRLRREITDAIEENGGRITYELIMGLPYLDMVVSETLRKYPTLPILDRIADSDYRVPGSDLVIEKGTPVYIPLTGLHYDPKYHEDPDKFNPERFSDVNKKSTKRAWYPFGDGPHSCIGQRLGLLQSKLGLIEMLRHYEFSPCDRTPIPMVLTRKGLMIHSEGGLYLHVKKLNS